MLKKSLIILSTFIVILFISNMCFASDLMQGAENTLERAGEGVHNMVDDATEATGNAKDNVSSMVEDIKNDSGNAEDNVRSESMSDDTMSTGGYTATRTSAPGTMDTGTNFVWIILAIAALAIVALVWYYGASTNSRNSH